MDDHAISLFGRKSYSEFFPNIPLLYERDYFVLFDYFTIHLPITGNWQKNRELNLFEESVLRMLGIGNYDASSLSETLCLPADLVSLILTRLEKKEYISNAKIITEKGNFYIGGKNASNSADLTPVYALVCRDSGDILPMLYPRTSMARMAESNRDSRKVSVTIGSAGKEEMLNYPYIVCKQSHNHKRLTNAEIHSLIRRHNNASEHSIYVPNDIRIEYSFEGSVFVHTKFILQEGYIDNILSSVGNSYHSPAVLKYALNGYPDLCSRIKRDAVSHMNDAGNKIKRQSTGRYGMLHRYLGSKTGDKDYSNIDELNENRADEAQMIRNLATAVEWSLAYHLREVGIPETLVLTLKAQTPQQNGIMLMEMAKLAGLPYTQKHKNFFSYVSYSNFSSWNEGGEPSFSLLLPIAAGVARRRSDSLLIPAMMSVGSTHRGDGLAFMAKLAEYGKMARHGEKSILTDGDTVQSLKNDVLTFVSTLLPNYQNKGEESSATKIYGSASQRKLNAEVKVMEALGDFVFYGLSDNVRGLLIESVRLSEIDDPIAMITTLSSALEKYFLNQYSPQNCEQNMKNLFIRLRKKDALPEGLTSVSKNFYNKATHGEKSTLGALALAWVGCLDNDAIEFVKQKNILGIVADIAAMRGHGGGSINLSADDVREAQIKVFDIVKWLEEK